MLSAKEYLETLRADERARQQAFEAEVEQIMRAAEVVPDLRVCGGVFYTSRVELTDSVMLDVLRGGCDGKHDDPAIVQAVPTVTVAGQVVRHLRGYPVATLLDELILAEPDWEQRMRVDRVPEPVIARCRALLLLIPGPSRRSEQSRPT